MTEAEATPVLASVELGPPPQLKFELELPVAPPQLKSRRTGKQVHARTVNKQMKKRVNDNAYTTAMKKLRYEREHLLTKDRATVVQIVAEVNGLYNSSLSAETIRRHIRLGKENITPSPGGGRRPGLPSPIIEALVNAVSSFIGLGCAEMQQQPAGWYSS